VQFKILGRIFSKIALNQKVSVQLQNHTKIVQFITFSSLIKKYYIAIKKH